MPTAANRAPQRYHSSMTRSELIDKLAERFPQLVHADAELSVKVLLDGMTAALVDGGRVEIRGFGSFHLNFRPAKIGRNPRTGEAVSVLAKRSPHFRPGKELRTLVQESGASNTHRRLKLAA